MKKNLDGRSSILKPIDENQSGGTTIRNPRRVSWHSVRIVKEFGSDIDGISGTPKQEPMYLTDGSTNLSAFVERENTCSVDVGEDVIMGDLLENNQTSNQTLMFFQKKEENHFASYQRETSSNSESTLAFLDKLPRNANPQDSFILHETLPQSGLEQTMGFFGGLDPRFVSPARTNTSVSKFEFTPVHFQSPTSEFSPMRVDTVAKKLFDESGLSPIKCLSNNIQSGTKISEQSDFKEDVDMMEDVVREELKMAVSGDSENIMTEDNNEVPENYQGKFENESNSSMMSEVSQKILETSLRVMAEYNPRLEELKKKTRRLSDQMAEITQSRRRSSLLNSPADMINATLSEMFEKPRAESSQMFSDPGITKTIFERSILSDSLIGPGGLERQSSDLFLRSPNSSGINGSTYTVHHSPALNSSRKPLLPRITAGSFHTPGFSSPLRRKSTQMLDDINTPTQLVTMNESEFIKATMKLDDSRKSDADTELVEAMIHDDILNVTTPTKRSVSKSGGNTFTMNSANKYESNNFGIEKVVSEDILSPKNIFENSFESVSSSNTLPIAPPTPGCNTMNYLQNLNMFISLEEEEEKEISAINLFPHLAELIKEEKEWKEAQGRSNSINYSRKYGHGDSLIGDNSFVMAQSMAWTPGKGMRGIEPVELFEEELVESSLGQSFFNSSINSIGKNEKQKNFDAYTMSSYGCCIRHLNPDEAVLMRQLESQVEQLKVFGENLTEAAPEVAEICESLKAEWIVYEERLLLSSIYYLSEIAIVDLLFKALNGLGVDKKINEVLFCTAKKAEEAHSTALKLFNEMRITFPKSKFAEKLGNAFFKDRLTNPEKKENYSKAVLERKKRNNELRSLHEERMRELKEKVRRREEEILIESDNLNQTFEETIAKVTENLKKLVQ